MRKILLFLLLFSSSPLLAQTAKVLICAPGDLNAAKATDTTLQKFYNEKIDLSDTLTDAINNYEAVFLLLNKGRKFTNEDGSFLLGFLKLNRKFYVEPGRIDDSNEFWKFIGVSQRFDALERHIKSIKGENGTFAEGLNIRNSRYDPLRADNEAAGLYIIGKQLVKVLVAECEATLDLAVTYETDSFKIVVHNPAIHDYYEPFLGRVICNYFGLCTPLKVESQNQIPKLSFSVYPNPAHDKFSVLFDAQHSPQNSLELFSSNGLLISKYSLGANQVDIDLGAQHLSSGTYFLRMLTEKGSVTRPVYLLSK